MTKIMMMLLIRSVCVFHLNGTALDQIESTVTATTYIIFRSLNSMSSFTIILLGICSRLYYSFGLLFCANSLVNSVPYSFRMTELKALSCGFAPYTLLRFPSFTKFNVVPKFYEPNRNSVTKKKIEKFDTYEGYHCIRQASEGFIKAQLTS